MFTNMIDVIFLYERSLGVSLQSSVYQCIVLPIRFSYLQYMYIFYDNKDLCLAFTLASKSKRVSLNHNVNGSL